ncbi:MAG: hypothetical protein R3F61_03885 [Myxococcota bacterium]
MPPTDPPEKPKPQPDPHALPDLPDIDESTDLIELNVDLDPGAAEPIGELALDDIDLLTGSEEVFALSAEEPEASDFPAAIRQVPIYLVEDDLEDFATQEELPILPWKLEVDLLELGVRVSAVLDPTRATSVWEHPDPSEQRVQVTLRLRMLDIAADIEVVTTTAGESRLRLGRDVIGGRLLIATE